MPIPKLLRKMSGISLRRKRSQSLDSNSASKLTRTPSPQEPVPPLPPLKDLNDGSYYIVTPSPSHPTEDSTNDAVSYHVVNPPIPAAAASQTVNDNQGFQYAKETDPQMFHSDVVPQDELGLSAAWTIANKAPVVSKTDKMLQNMENGMVGANNLQINSTMIVAGVTTFLESTGGMKAIGEGINHFFEGSTVLMNALDEVAKLHPFVGVAVMAFKAVWTLEMKRRENDKKIIALYVEMKDMMEVLVQLKSIKDAEKIAPDGSTIKGRMQDLIRATAEDIKSCANACDTYSKKKLLVKILKGPIWEGRLVAFVATFTKRRSEFEFALSIHTSLGVDAANQTLSSVDQTTRLIEAKMDVIMKMFEGFMLPDQKEITRLIEQKGGIQACQTDDKILKMLCACEQKTGVSSSGALQVGLKLGGKTPASDLEELKTDLNANLDAAMEKNMTVFSRKFDVQLNQLQEELTRVVEREGDRVISAVTSGPHDKIIDPDVHKVWKEMGWRGSVKARTFVMGLRDYFQERWDSNAAPIPAPDAADDDSWALAYLNVVRLQPISEAFDDDASGFVTVAEVNTFTTSRPLGWSLPHWIAYWAIGWHQSMIIYRENISELIAKMFAILPNIMVSNREGVNKYLSSCYTTIQTINASLKECYVNDALQAKFQSYVESEEARILKNLQAVRHDIDAMDTLALVTGPGRVEKYILPLLYLLLKHHFELFRICQKHETHSDELWDAAETIEWVIVAAYERVDVLQSLFEHQKLDLKQQFKSFAHGIFEYTNDSSVLWDPKKVNEEEPPDYPYDDNLEDQEVKKENILNYPCDQEQLDFAAYDSPTPDPDITQISHPLRTVLGRWNGVLYLNHASTVPMAWMISMTLLPVEGQDCRFHASSKSGTSDFSVSGECTTRETPDTVAIEFKRTFPARHPTTYFHGVWEAATDTLTGSWGLELDHSTHSDLCVFKRTAPERLCFLPPPSEFKDNKARALWTYAISSTRAEIRRNNWSWSFFRQRRDNRKRFIELFIRSTEYGKPLDANEREEFARVRKTFTTAESRFYHSLAAYQIRRTVGHNGISCDNCTGTISGGRISCLMCQTKETFNTVDLCELPECVSAEVTREDLTRVHLPTHDLVKMRRVVHVMQFGKFYREAKEALERARSIFPSKTVEGGGADDNPNGLLTRKNSEEVVVSGMSGNSQISPDEPSAPTCAICKLPLSHPCWYCVQCSGDIFICYSCDLQGGKMLGDHLDTHDLVRCQALVEVVDVSIESRLATLEERFAEHRLTMGESLNQLDKKVDSRLSILENLLNAILQNSQSQG